MDNGKVLICNFAQREIGEDTSALLGTMVLTELKLAAEHRAGIPEHQRRPFFTYVDEFQNFATAVFLKMPSTSRKFGLYLIIAEQSTAQQDEPSMTKQILSNVSTVITFRTGSPADKRLLLPHFAPQLELGDIGNLPAFHFYARTQAVQSLEPFSGVTILLPPVTDSNIAEQAIAASRKLYGGVIILDEPTPDRQPKHI